MITFDFLIIISSFIVSIRIYALGESELDVRGKALGIRTAGALSFLHQIYIVRSIPELNNVA